MILKILALAYLVFACSSGGVVRSSPKDSDLSAQIWAKMLEAENDSENVYREDLTPDLLEKHKAGLFSIADKIPYSYPEPYLPYGQLSNKDLDPGLSRPPLLNDDTIALGKRLFNDKTLSYSQTHGFSSELGMSCASCHVETEEFTDKQPLSKGIEGDFSLRNTPSLWNSVYFSTLTWSNPIFPIFEIQAKIPLFNDDPIEMGLRGKERDLLGKLSENESYVKEFKRIYDFDLNTSSVDYTVLTSALAAYERSLIRFDSAFDLYLQGKEHLDEDAKMGARFFYGLASLQDGSTLACAKCHAGFLMTDSFQYVRNGTYFNQVVFHESIRTPSLRFVSKTAPYFHDGSMNSLDEILDFYSAGKRNNPTQASFVLREDERKALKAFFEAL